MTALKIALLLGLLAVAGLAVFTEHGGDVAVPPRAIGGLRPDVPTYGVRGPFGVGYKTLTVETGTDQPLEIDLWYPALNAMGVTEAIVYEITLKNPGLSIDTPPVIYGRALPGALFDHSMKPYPLVIFSHGFSLSPEWYSTLLEHYASHGFIVLAPEHVEQDWSEAALESIDRPRDIVQTLDLAEELTAVGGGLDGLIDMENVAVVGHSFGGYTALAMGGAQLDLNALGERIAALPPDDPSAWIGMPFVGREADMAARAGLDSVPEGLWPSFGDPRVKAIITMAGDSFMFDQAGLSKVTIPMMAMGGTADTGTPYDWGTRPSYDHASSVRKALVAFVGGEHMFVSTPCEDMPWTSALDPYVYGMICLEPVWDKNRVLDLAHHFSTAFLLDILKGDVDAHEALLPDAVYFPGIDYVTTLE